jgi:hypothetical protein
MIHDVMYNVIADFDAKKDDFHQGMFSTMVSLQWYWSSQKLYSDSVLSDLSVSSGRRIVSSTMWICCRPNKISPIEWKQSSH